MINGPFPNITLAQIVAALFGALYPALTLFGIDLSVEQKDALEELKWVALGLFGADAGIRIGRNIGNSYPPADDDSNVPSDVPTEDELRNDYAEDPPSQSEPVDVHAAHPHPETPHKLI